MSVINYPSNSPYAATPQTSWYLQNLVFRPIRPDADDQPFTLLLRHQHRPDKLAFEKFGSASYWWVFCVRNPVLRADPIWGFVAGLEIMIPSAKAIKQIG